MDLGLDYHDEELSIVIFFSCVYVDLIWMTGRTDIAEPILDILGTLRKDFTLKRFSDGAP